MTQYETPAFRMQISDDLLKEITVKKGVIINAQDVKTSLELSLKEGVAQKYFVLLEGEEGSNVSDEARVLAASEEYSRHVAALALCSSNLAMAILGNLFLKVNRPKVPTKFFRERADALFWLRSQM